MVKKRKKVIKKAVKKVKKGPVRKLRKTQIIKDKDKISNEVKKIKIRVIGIGAGGGNIVSEISQRVKKASFFRADTDSKVLKKFASNVEKFQFGQSLTQGFGTGMNPEMGKIAAKNEKEKIKKILQNQDLVILIACLGGGVGSGAAPIFARISKNLGNLTYGIFTLPFKFEGEKKMEIAKNSLRELKGKLNALSIIPNEKIFQIIDRRTPLKKALSSINKSLEDSLQSLIEIIYLPGLINIDFADLKTVFEGRGYLTYLNSIEIEKEEEKAIEKVSHSPLYPYSIEGAKGVLLNISDQKNLSLAQVSQISKSILEKVHQEAKIIFGISQSSKQSKMKITILATGCSKLPQLIKSQTPQKPKRLKPEFAKKTTKRPQKVAKIKIIKPVRNSDSKPTPKSPARKISNWVKVKKKVKEGTPLESKGVVRKNGLQIKKEIEEEESEIMAKEKFWETPTFLRKKA